MNNRRRSLIFCFIFILGTSCFCQNNFQILKHPNLELKTSFTLPTKSSLKNEGPSVAESLGLDFSSIYTDFTVAVANKSSDYLFNFLIKPLSFNQFELGLGVTIHLYDYFQTFEETDVVLGNYFGFLNKDVFRFNINWGVIGKITKFLNDKISKNLIYTTLLLGVDFVWNINKIFSLYGGFNSVGRYDYSLFGTPYCNLGLDINVKNNITVGFDYNVKLIDMVAVAENISEMLLILYMKVDL